MPLTHDFISARLSCALRRALLTAALPFCFWGAQATAQSVLPGSAAKLSSVVTTSEVRAELLAHAPQGVAAGQPLWLGLQITHQP